MNNMWSFAFQNMDKVAQSKGPFEFIFKEDAEDAYF